MKHFTTFTQHRILKDYWQNHIPFTVFSLMERRAAVYCNNRNQRRVGRYMEIQTPVFRDLLCSI